MKVFIICCLFTLFLFSCRDTDFDDSLDLTVPVSVEEVKLRSIEEFITGTATARAVKQTQLTSEIAGYYRRAVNPETKKPFAPGDRVRQDQVIVYLDNAEHENNVRIEAKKLNLDISKNEYEKQQSLYDKGGVTLRELKNSEQAYIEAQYNYENALLQIGKMQIKSPFDGLIVDLPYYTTGSKIAAGQLMAEIMDYEQLYAEVNLPAKELTRVAMDQKVRFMHYSAPGDTLEGSVKHVSPAIDPETRAFKTQIIVNNSDLLLRPGMFVQVEIVVRSRENVVVIPRDIILTRRRGKTVFVMAKGAAEERAIKTGLENADQVEVTEGLSKDERLIVKGFETLQNHSKVKVVR